MKYKLSELGIIVTGNTPSKNIIDAYGNEMKFLSPRDFKGQRFSNIIERGLSSKGIEVLKSKIVPFPSISVTCIGMDMGKTILNNEKVITNQQINSIYEFSEEINHLYLYYILRTMKDELFLNGVHNGSRTPIINKKYFSNIEVEIPSLKVQNSVVNILNSLDSKIELNNQIIDTLEEIASTLFKRWFVNFEFPDENGNPYKSSGGKMIDSELGEIPKGWDITSIDNLYNIKYGKELAMSKLKNSGYPVQGANGKIIGYTDSFLYKEEVALVTCRGNGSGDVFRSLKEGFVTNNLLVFEPLDKRQVDYTRFLLTNGNTYNFRTGSAQPQITIKNISKMKVINPFVNVLEKYEELVEPIMNHQISVQESNTTFEQVRNSLLPKLLSGEIEV